MGYLIPAVTVTVTVIFDNSSEKCINKRCGGISPTKYAVQYTRTDIHNYRFIVYDNFRSGIVRIVSVCLSPYCFIIIVRLMPIYKVYSIGRTWSWPVMSASACFVYYLEISYQYGGSIAKVRH